MGLLDQVLGGIAGGGGGANATPAGVAGGGGLNSPVVKALMLLLAAKAAQSYASRGQQGAAGAAAAPASFPTPGGGGLGGVLGGILGGATAPGGGGGLGGLIGSVAGGGGLGALVGQFTRNGYGDVINSWIGHGPNRPIAPDQLAGALGDDTVQHLQQESGLPREQVLSQLSTALPAAVDQLTPHGTLPGPEEMKQW